MVHINAQKKCASTHVFFYIKRVRVRSYVGVRARETPIITKINNINF